MTPRSLTIFTCTLFFCVDRHFCVDRVLADPILNSITANSQMPLETIRTQLHSNPHQQMVNPQVLQAYQLSQQSQQSLTYKTEKIQILTDDLSASSNVASTRVGGSGKTQKTSGLEVICEPNPCIPITSLCETDDSSKGYRCNEVRPSQEFVDQPNISTSTSTTRDVATTLVSSTANSSRASGTVATAVDVCMAVTCSFDTDLCKYKSSSWTWTNSRRLLNKLTGVRGDHSGTGGYTYVLGNVTGEAELASLPFKLANDSQLYFWRHTAGHSGLLAVCLEGQPANQPCIWLRDQSQELTPADRKWQEEKIAIPKGSNRIRFVASKLGGENYVVGIDDVKLMTSDNSLPASCTGSTQPEAFLLE